MHHPMSHQLVAMMLAVITLMSGLAPAQDIRPITDRLDAIVSYPLVISLSVEDEAQLRRGVTTRIDDGRTFTSQPFWVGLTPYRSLPSWTRMPGQWEATAYRDIRDTPIAQRPPGSWFILVPLPIDAVGQGLWFGQTRYELNWLPDPERALLEADTAEHTRDFAQFWSMHLDSQALSDPSVRTAVEQYHRNPFQNWRSRLLTDGLDPDRTRARETHAQSITTESIELELQAQTPGNDLLAAIARQQEARWQIILGRIWLIDPDTAQRMKLALTRTARFGDRILPLWNADSTELSRLAHDLLSPFVGDDTRVLRAKAWLETQPRALAWIIDDQGTLEAGTSRFLPSLGVISLPSEPGSSLLRIDARGLEAPMLETIPPDRLQEIQIPIEPRDISPTNPQIVTERVDLRLGRWGQSHELIASRVPAGAPFVRVGPLLADWTMPSLLNNRPLEHATVTPDRATSGILWRTSTPGRKNPKSGWRLFFECAAPNPGQRDDTLTIWIGPRDYPTAAWRIRPDGLVETVRSNASVIVPQPSVETRILQDRWIAQIDLPDIVFDQDGHLMLGIERSDANGVHSAWPRRMFPGQAVPGRLMITPDRFDNLRLP